MYEQNKKEIVPYVSKEASYKNNVPWYRSKDTFDVTYP